MVFGMGEGFDVGVVDCYVESFSFLSFLCF